MIFQAILLWMRAFLMDDYITLSLLLYLRDCGILPHGIMCRLNGYLILKVSVMGSNCMSCVVLFAVLTPFSTEQCKVRVYCRPELRRVSCMGVK